MAHEFVNRDAAGARLADRLAGMDWHDPVVLALPRGGVPVALPVARALDAPLDLCLVRKIGMPGHEEYAAGAVVDGDPPITVFNEGILEAAGLTERDFAEVTRDKIRQIAVRRETYLAGRSPEPLEARDVILVDDGIATGATVRAALKGLSQSGARRVVLAVPVAPGDSLADLAEMVDETICLETPVPFFAVGMHYRDFEQVSDEEVVAMLAEFKRGEYE